MDKILYICLGFILGILVTFYIILEEIVEGLTKEKIKKLYEIFIKNK